MTAPQGGRGGGEALPTICRSGFCGVFFRHDEFSLPVHLFQELKKLLFQLGGAPGVDERVVGALLIFIVVEHVLKVLSSS